jgi:predicted MFS family arabinose efflux permease
MTSERRLLFLLAGVYLTYMLDYMLMPALTQFFIRDFKTDATQLGKLVSAYNFSAAVFGLLGAFMLDRFDRKRALLLLYGGFIVSMLLCGLSSSQDALFAARIVAGAFGGLMVATVFSIIGDAVPPERQGAAFGTVLSAFAIASLTGTPLGLWIASSLAWNYVFVVIAALSGVMFLLVTIVMPTLNEHLSDANPLSGSTRLLHLVSTSGNYFSFAVIALISIASAAVIPYINPYLEANLHLSDSQIRIFYIVGGICTFLVSYPTGWLADKLGKWKTFFAISLTLAPSAIFFTMIPDIFFAGMIGIFALFMTLSRARRIPGLAIITSSVAPAERAGFMSLNASVEQFAAGLAITLAGKIIVKPVSTTGELLPLENFYIVGYIISAAVLFAALLLRFVNSPANEVRPRAMERVSV